MRLDCHTSQVSQNLHMQRFIRIRCTSVPLLFFVSLSGWLTFKYLGKAAVPPCDSHTTGLCTQSSTCRGVNRETTKHRHLACASFLFVCLVQNLWHQQCFERGLAGRYFSVYVYGQLTCQILSLRRYASDMSTSSTQCIFFFSKTCCSSAPVSKNVIGCGGFHLSEYEEALQVPYTCDAEMVCEYASVMLASLPLGVST